MASKSNSTSRPNILITNDDGVYAPGIRSLWQSLKNVADLTVVAPAGEQSSVALSITLRQPLRIETVNWGTGIDRIWSVNGTPADCVKLALNTILDKKPDFIISGINRGSNLGRNVLYSGTVGAAIEGVLQEIPSAALSSMEYHTPDYDTIGSYAPYIIEHLRAHPLPEGTLLNVNFPERRLGKFVGFKMTSQGTEYWMENPDKREHPGEGHAYYWLGSLLKEGNANSDSDDNWIKRGYITAVPVHIGNLTDWRHLEKAKERFEKSFPVDI